MPHFETWVGWWSFWFLAIPLGMILVCGAIKICIEIFKIL